MNREQSRALVEKYVRKLMALLGELEAEDGMLQAREMMIALNSITALILCNAPEPVREKMIRKQRTHFENTLADYIKNGEGSENIVAVSQQ